MQKSFAPAINSAIRILSLLAADSPRWLSASEIARATDLSRASVHRFLLELWNGGFVMRHPQDMTYTLGTRLIEFGARATGEGPMLELVRDAVIELAKDTRLGVEALQGLPDGEFVCLAAHANPGQLSVVRVVGSTIPVLPEVSHMHLAWSSAGDSTADYPPLASKFFDEDLQIIRRKGYGWVMIAGDNSAKNLADIGLWLEEAAEFDLTRKSAAGRKAQIEEISRYTVIRNTHTPHGIVLPVLGVTAPIFDAGGKIPLRLVIVGLLAQITPDMVDPIGRRVRRKADQITSVIGGRKPDQAG